MNHTGKKRRKASGLTRAALHKSSHAIKSPAKIRRMGWSRKKS